MGEPQALGYGAQALRLDHSDLAVVAGFKSPWATAVYTRTGGPKYFSVVICPMFIFLNNFSPEFCIKNWDDTPRIPLIPLPYQLLNHLLSIIR